MGYRPGRMALRIAHRGYRTVAAENSLDQIAHALELGADFVELDVRRRPSDGVLVLDHDRGDRPGAPTLAEALALVAATPARAPTSISRRAASRTTSSPRSASPASSGARSAPAASGSELAAIKRDEPGIRIGITVPRTAYNVPASSPATASCCSAARGRAACRASCGSTTRTSSPLITASSTGG